MAYQSNHDRNFSASDTGANDGVSPAGSRLEQYLLETGIIDNGELLLAKKMQRRDQGPLLMVLLRLNFIDVVQLEQLWDFELSAWAS